MNQKFVQVKYDFIFNLFYFSNIASVYIAVLFSLNCYKINLAKYLSFK